MATHSRMTPARPALWPTPKNAKSAQANPTRVAGTTLPTLQTDQSRTRVVAGTRFPSCTRRGRGMDREGVGYSSRVVRDGDRWPQSLQLVRHGESCGNVARDSAESAGLPMIDIAERDMDVPLSNRGRDQASALGRWLGDL